MDLQGRAYHTSNAISQVGKAGLPPLLPMKNEKSEMIFGKFRLP
jgi:hypothetical protein